MFSLPTSPEIPDMYLALQSTEECEFIDGQGDDCTTDLQNAFCFHGIEVSSEYSCPGGCAKRSPLDWSASEIVSPFTRLLSVYPNPFSYQTQIHFEIVKDAHVDIEVLDLLGRVIDTITRGEYTIGSHSIEWRGLSKGTQLPAGIYYLRFTTESEVVVEPITLLR